MKEVDWSKAPEGAVYYGSIGIGQFPVWASDDWYEYLDGRRFDFDDMNVEAFPREGLEIKSRRPFTKAPWTGPEDGLPPVGAVCEVFEDGFLTGDWSMCTILLHNVGSNGRKQVVARDFRGDIAIYYPEEEGVRFRPLQPDPKQIAAEEREKAIKEMMDIPPFNYDGDRQFAELLYDAGYRKCSE